MTSSWGYGGEKKVDVVIIKLGTFASAVHKNIKSLTWEESGERYIITEADGSITGVKKEHYIVQVLR